MNVADPASATPADRNTAADARVVHTPADLAPVLRLFGALLCCASAVLAALIEVLLVPLYFGGTLVPLTIALAVATNVALPWLVRVMTGSTGAACAPVALWILVSVALSSSRPEGDVLLPGGGSLEYVSYGLLGAGCVAGVVTVGTVGRGGRRRAGQPRGSGSIRYR